MSRAGERAPAASLGLLDATMVGIGAMLGAGVFVLTGLAAEPAGTAALPPGGASWSRTPTPDASPVPIRPSNPVAATSWPPNPASPTR